MDRCTHNVRAQYWKDIIQQCQMRPQNQTIKSWLKERGICENSYYVWQRRFRQEAYDLIKAVPTVLSEKAENVSFAEIRLPEPETEKSFNTYEQQIKPTAIIKCGQTSIAITNDTSEHILNILLKEVLHA